MDYTILIIIGILAGLMGLALGIGWLRRKGYIIPEDLYLVMKAFDLTIQVVDELNLDKEEEIKKVADLVSLSLHYAYEVVDSENQEPDYIFTIAKNYLDKFAEELGLEMTSSRREIVEGLLMVAIEKEWS